MANQTWTADRRLYLDKDGKVVEANDPTRTRLLVAAGNTIPIEEAQRLGLIVEEKAAEPRPNKARPGPSENKAEVAPTLDPETDEVPAQEETFAERPEGAEPGIQEDGQGLPPVAEPEVEFIPAPALEEAVNEPPKRNRKG